MRKHVCIYAIISDQKHTKRLRANTNTLNTQKSFLLQFSPNVILSPSTAKNNEPTESQRVNKK